MINRINNNRDFLKIIAAVLPLFVVINLFSPQYNGQTDKLRGPHETVITALEVTSAQFISFKTQNSDRCSQHVETGSSIVRETNLDYMIKIRQRLYSFKYDLSHIISYRDFLAVQLAENT